MRISIILNHHQAPQNFSSTLHWGQAHVVTNARKSERTFLRNGYSCFDLDQSKTTLQVLPSEFLPAELCTCLPGWSGKGANCSECDVDTYKRDPGPAACTSCEWNTTTNGKRASKSEHDCKCKKTFRKHQKGEALSDTCP